MVVRLVDDLSVRVPERAHGRDVHDPRDLGRERGAHHVLGAATRWPRTSPRARSSGSQPRTPRPRGSPRRSRSSPRAAPPRRTGLREPARSRSRAAARPSRRCGTAPRPRRRGRAARDTTCPPMNPVPPVTKTFMPGAYTCFSATHPQRQDRRDALRRGRGGRVKPARPPARSRGWGAARARSRRPAGGAEGAPADGGRRDRGRAGPAPRRARPRPLPRPGQAEPS